MIKTVKPAHIYALGFITKFLLLKNVAFTSPNIFIQLEMGSRLLCNEKGCSGSGMMKVKTLQKCQT